MLARCDKIGCSPKYGVSFVQTKTKLERGTFALLGSRFNFAKGDVSNIFFLLLNLDLFSVIFASMFLQ